MRVKYNLYIFIMLHMDFNELQIILTYFNWVGRYTYFINIILNIELKSYHLSNCIKLHDIHFSDILNCIKTL